ncbi:MAG: TIGR03564 family F420-dependent LLM class oxidoreductase [Acidimicrobiia bacterium]
MRIGIFGGEPAGVDGTIAGAREAAEQGFSAYWVSQIFGFDSLTVLAIVGREVPDIELGTGVVPTYPRHPMMLAQQALTVSLATGGRLMLGIGLSHKVVIENMFGLSFKHPLRHMREYLSILMPLIHTGTVSFTGETLSTNASISTPDAPPCPVLVAALGPKMLELAGTVADGTVTWMTGAETLRTLTVPTITKAAAAAAHPTPRVGVSLPVCVTSDADAARARAAKVFQVYGVLPSYRAMLDREGAAGPEDVAIIGSEAEVKAEIQRIEDAGATDFVAAEFAATDDERVRTRELLRSLL